METEYSDSGSGAKWLRFASWGASWRMPEQCTRHDKSSADKHMRSGGRGTWRPSQYLGTGSVRQRLSFSSTSAQMSQASSSLRRSPLTNGGRWKDQSCSLPYSEQNLRDDFCLGAQAVIATRSITDPSERLLPPVTCAAIPAGLERVTETFG